MESLVDVFAGQPRNRYTGVAEQLHRERQAYLAKVARGRRVARVDPLDVRYSQQADDERQAKLAGLGSLLPFRPDRYTTAGAPVAVAQAEPRTESLFDLVRSSPLERAQSQLQMTPQERALYERHLENLRGPGKVMNRDGSISTLYQLSVEGPGGKTYNIPSVYEGRIVSPAVAIDRAARYGWNFFPSYDDVQTAEGRYRQMHSFMDQDIQQYRRKDR